MTNMLDYTKEQLNNKKIVLGVAFEWGPRKGLDVFIELSKRLPDLYKIVLVGTNKQIDSQLPKEIISVHRTQNQKELAELYTRADVFVIPTREENFPTVNLESMACGTPVVTFQTGGSPEMLNSKTGVIVPVNDIEALKQAIIDVCVNQKCDNSKYIVEYAKKYDMNDKFIEYMDLYTRILGD